MLAGWRRKGMSCLVGGCNRIGSRRYWPAKSETMALDAEKICTSCFRVLKTEAAKKSIWRLTGWPLRLLNVNGRFWPVGAEKECALRIFAPEKFALAFSACRPNFILLFLAAGAAFHGKTRHKR